MWFLVQVVKGSKYFEADSQIGNRVMISDTSDMVISGRSMGAEGYRFEARKGNDSFVLQEFPGAHPAGGLGGKFKALAQQIGAVVIGDEAHPVAKAA